MKTNAEIVKFVSEVAVYNNLFQETGEFENDVAIDVYDALETLLPGYWIDVDVKVTHISPSVESIAIEVELAVDEGDTIKISVEVKLVTE